MISWFDDWYAIEEIAPGLFGIGEPKYHQINWNYLIIGRDRALLFDTGPGLRDITPVVASLTDKPVTALLSHLPFRSHRQFPSLRRPRVGRSADPAHLRDQWRAHRT
jgi:hypothetical protein